MWSTIGHLAIGFVVGYGLCCLMGCAKCGSEQDDGISDLVAKQRRAATN